MSWFLCVISQKPFLEWEIEKFLQVHPQTPNTMIKPSFYFSYHCRPDLNFRKKPTDDDLNHKIVIGQGYVSKNTGFSQADEHDWQKLLDFEYLPADIDGHYLAIKIRDDFLQITSDMYGHYPVYYVDTEDYIIVSNKQHYVTSLMGKRPWDYSSLSALTLLNMPLQKTPFLKNVSILGEGSTLTIKNSKISVANRDLKFVSDKDPDIHTYLFSLKKAFELQLNENEFISLPFEAKYSSRFAFSVLCNKAKKTWGLYCLQSKNISPEKYLDSFILNKLRISYIPEFKDSSEVFLLYKDYVLSSCLSDFPEVFYLAGNYASTLNKEINFFSYQSEWLFEKDPLKKFEKMFKILKMKSYVHFKKHYVLENYFFRKEFYTFLLKGLSQHFEEFTQKMIVTETLYDQYYFFLKNYQINICARNLAWLNEFRNFYSPGMLYSLACHHLQQRFINKKISDISIDLHENLSEESKFFPKPKELHYNIPPYPNQNQLYFPLIINEIGGLIEKAQKMPYYNFSSLLKIYKKAQRGNDKAIAIMMKWASFEIWREFLE